MPLKRFLAVSAASLSIYAFRAHAGASLVVDDAAATPRGRCQLESWTRAYAPGAEFTAVPACNVGGIEAGLGLSHHSDGGDRNAVSLGLKTLVRDFDAHDWGVAVSAGASWSGAHRRYDGWNVNVPASFALDAERRTVLHANLGWAKPRHGHGAVTGGVGIEHRLDERWHALAEAYGDDRGGRGAQLGVRRALGDAASFDLLAGHDRHTSWLTLGLNVTLPN
jgi:hypothetical protein